MPKRKKIDALSTIKKSRFVKRANADELVSIAESAISKCDGAFEEKFGEQGVPVKDCNDMLLRAEYDMPVRDILLFSVPLVDKLAIQDPLKMNERLSRLADRCDIVTRNLQNARAFISTLNGRLENADKTIERMPRPRSKSF